jgi:hypothetical protein
VRCATAQFSSSLQTSVTISAHQWLKNQLLLLPPVPVTCYFFSDNQCLPRRSPFDGFDPFDKPRDQLGALSLSKRLRADRLTASKLRAKAGSFCIEPRRKIPHCCDSSDRSSRFFHR